MTSSNLPDLAVGRCEAPTFRAPSAILGETKVLGNDDKLPKTMIVVPDLP
jgi:hypothetical protein